MLVWSGQGQHRGAREHEVLLSLRNYRYSWWGASNPHHQRSHSKIITNSVQSIILNLHIAISRWEPSIAYTCVYKRFLGFAASNKIFFSRKKSKGQSYIFVKTNPKKIELCPKFTSLHEGAFDSAKNHKRQRRKRQSLTAKREKSQTPKFV